MEDVADWLTSGFPQSNVPAQEGFHPLTPLDIYNVPARIHKRETGLYGNHYMRYRLYVNFGEMLPELQGEWARYVDTRGPSRDGGF